MLITTLSLLDSLAARHILYLYAAQRYSTCWYFHIFSLCWDLSLGKSLSLDKQDSTKLKLNSLHKTWQVLYVLSHLDLPTKCTAWTSLHYC